MTFRLMLPRIRAEINDPNSVADWLDELIQDKVLRITMGRKGREQ